MNKYESTVRLFCQENVQNSFPSTSSQAHTLPMSHFFTWADIDITFSEEERMCKGRGRWLCAEFCSTCGTEPGLESGPTSVCNRYSDSHERIWIYALLRSWRDDTNVNIIVSTKKGVKLLNQNPVFQALGLNGFARSIELKYR